MAHFSLKVGTNLIYLQEIVWVNRPDSLAFIPLLVLFGFPSLVSQGTSGKSPFQGGKGGFRKVPSPHGAPHGAAERLPWLTKGRGYKAVSHSRRAVEQGFPRRTLGKPGGTKISRLKKT